MARRKWTDEEISLLKDTRKNNKEIAKILNRSSGCVSAKRVRESLNLKKCWSKSEIEYIKNNTNQSAKELALILNRTKDGVAFIMKKQKIRSTHKHGGRKTRLYSIWRAMKQRCYNHKAHNYYRYGGRGIYVCEEWRNSFVSFRDWALNNGYRDDLSIDRINNDSNYYPENCRWATQKEQANNTSRNKKKV